MEIAASWWDDAYEHPTTAPAVEEIVLDERVKQAQLVVFVVGGRLAHDTTKEAWGVHMVDKAAVVTVAASAVDAPVACAMLAQLDNVFIMDYSKQVECCLYANEQQPKTCPRPKTFQWHTGPSAWLLSQLTMHQRHGTLLCTACAPQLLQSLGGVSIKHARQPAYQAFYS